MKYKVILSAIFHLLPDRPQEAFFNSIEKIFPIIWMIFLIYTAKNLKF